MRIVVVSFQGGAVGERYVQESGLDWPILIDTSLELYRAYGMERGGLWPIWGPPAWWAYVKLLLRGRRLRRISGDTLQLGGDVIIGPDGIVRYRHVGTGPADRPSVDELLNEIRAHRPRAAGPGSGMASG